MQMYTTCCANAFLVGSCAISDQQHLRALPRCIKSVQIMAEVLAEQSKPLLGHIGKQQTKQSSPVGIDGRVEIAIIISQLQLALGALTFGRPLLFARRTGAATHLIFKEDMLPIKGTQ